MDYSNIFSPNRIGRSDMVEKGNHTLGIEFEKQNLMKSFYFNIGNIFKDQRIIRCPLNQN